MFDAEILADIEVTSKPTYAPRVLPVPGNYTVVLAGVGPAINSFGTLEKEFGRPLFAIEELSIVGPFPAHGDFKLWQRLPMVDVKEFDRNVNYLRDLVRAYDEDAEFANATEAFQLIEEYVEAGREINVRVMYYAEDFKGKQQALVDEGLKGIPFSQLTDEQKARKNEIERSSKVRGVKPFLNEDGETYNSQWLSPFGNLVPVRLSISRFYNSGYNPFVS